MPKLSTSLLIALVIIYTAIILCKCKKMISHNSQNTGTEPFKNNSPWHGISRNTQRLTPNPIYNKNPITNNILNPNSPIFSSPNMVNFDDKINNIQMGEKRRSHFYPNEETFNPGKTEFYRPGDWNVNGITAMNMINGLKNNRMKI